MMPCHALNAIEHLVRDLQTDYGLVKSKLFGGKTILLCGDWRQTW